MLLYIFDLDHTTISPYMLNPNKDFFTWELMPGIKELFQAIMDEGGRIALVTNQAGVAFGKLTEMDVINKMCSIAEDAGLPEDTPCYYDVSHPKSKTHPPTGRRLPNPALLEEAAREAGVHPSLSYFVCNYQPFQGAAKRAGMELIESHDLMKHFGIETMTPLVGLEDIRWAPEGTPMVYRNGSWRKVA